jgi:hypothetical protein
VARWFAPRSDFERQHIEATLDPILSLVEGNSKPCVAELIDDRPTCSSRNCHTITNDQVHRGLNALCDAEATDKWPLRDHLFEIDTHGALWHADCIAWVLFKEDHQTIRAQTTHNNTNGAHVDSNDIVEHKVVQGNHSLTETEGTRERLHKGLRQNVDTKLRAVLLCIKPDCHMESIAKVSDDNSRCALPDANSIAKDDIAVSSHFLPRAKPSIAEAMQGIDFFVFQGLLLSLFGLLWGKPFDRIAECKRACGQPERHLGTTATRTARNP